MPGARETLDLIAAQGIAMALVTNTERELADEALATLGRTGSPSPSAAMRWSRVNRRRIRTCGQLNSSESTLRIAWPWRTHRPELRPPVPPVVRFWWCPRPHPSRPAKDRQEASPNLVGATLDDVAAAFNGTIEHREDLR